MVIRNNHLLLNLIFKFVILTGYLIMSTLFLYLDLESLWSPPVIIAFSALIPMMTMIIFGLTATSYSSIGWATSLWGWLGSLFLTWRIEYIGIGFILNSVINYAVIVLSEKLKFLTKLRDLVRRPYEIISLWIIYLISASVPTSAGLARLNNELSLIPIIIYGMVFGWFSPEVNPKIITGRIRPLLLQGAYFISVIAFYILVDTINPALYSDALDIVVMLSVGYIGINSMLISRCTLEALICHAH